MKPRWRPVPVKALDPNDHTKKQGTVNSLEINQCSQCYCLICVLTALHGVLENEIQWNQVNTDFSQSPIFSVRSSRSSALRYGFLMFEFSESSLGMSMKSCMKSK